MQTANVRQFQPLAREWRSFAWDGGVFDTAVRPHTDSVEGVICTSHHLILVTLDGGAEHQEVTSACGHRYEGSDRRGAVSFVPARCERTLRLRGVRSRWASLSLSPALSAGDEDFPSPNDVATFTNVEDSFLASAVAEFARLYRADGALDRTYCDTMSQAIAAYLSRRYGQRQAREPITWKLPPWRLKRIGEYVDANLESEIRIADLARLVGVSCGHLHRAFRATTGQTPLAFITERRVQKAMHYLAREEAAVCDIALRVGFINPSHFARTFRRMTGVTPSQYRGGANPRG